MSSISAFFAFSKFFSGNLCFFFGSFSFSLNDFLLSCFISGFFFLSFVYKWTGSSWNWTLFSLFLVFFNLFINFFLILKVTSKFLLNFLHFCFLNLSLSFFLSSFSNYFSSLSLIFMSFKFFLFSWADSLFLMIFGRLSYDMCISSTIFCLFWFLWGFLFFNIGNYFFFISLLSNISSLISSSLSFGLKLFGIIYLSF